jgi:hypothetical protein
VTRPPLPDEDMERTERITAVRTVLERIPERDRQLLLMREEGFQVRRDRGGSSASRRHPSAR